MISLISMIIIVGNNDMRLAFALLLFIPLSMIVYGILGKLNFKANVLLTSKTATLTQFLSELINSLPLIKIFNAQQKEEKRGEEAIRQLFLAEVKAKILTGLGIPVYGILELASSIVIIGLGLSFVKDGSLQLSQWVAFYMYANQLIQNLNSQGSFWQNLKAAQGATSRIASIVDEEEEKDGTVMISSITSIELNNVEFGYNEDLVLKNVSMKLTSPSLVIINGNSGSGKSTIFHLIEKFYPITNGSLLINNININDINNQSLREKISYLTQETLINSGTIKENLLYGNKKEITDEQCKEALKNCCLDYLTNELNTDIGQLGNKLSGGQKQLLAIAKESLKDSTVLLVDEAISNLDPLSTKAIIQSLLQLSKTKIVVVVDHNMLFNDVADTIYTLKDGEIL